MYRVSAFWKVDKSWPTWAFARFNASYFFNEDAVVDKSNMTWHPHNVFGARPDEVKLERSDRRSAVVIYDGKKPIGEAWFRLAFGMKDHSLKPSSFCEMYEYRRGFRDKITADMDEEPHGYYIVPSREADMYCTISKKDRLIFLRIGTFCVKLSRIDE